MPYKSDAQRRFFHTDTAKKAGITDKEVNEFDQASKGKKLPEHTKKMAFGGETNPKHETVKSMENNPTAGFAEGGEVQPKGDKFQEDFKEGFRNGIQGDWDKIKAAISDTGNKIHDNYTSAMGDNGNLKGLQKVADEKAKGYAGGGMVEDDAALDAPYDASIGNAMSGAFSNVMGSMNPLNAIKAAAPAVTNAVQDLNPMNALAQKLAMSNMNSQLAQKPQPDNAFINQLNQGINTANPPAQSPTGPSLSQASQAAQNSPSTPPNIYQGISAEDRANLYKQLLAQKSSPGMLAASGAAGLGDAITSAFGKAPTNAQGNLRQAAQQNVEQRVGAVDTERQQKLQDVQANIAVQKADPNSSFSQGMRQFLKSQGIGVPSGMSAAMLEPMFGEMAKMFEARTVAATAAGAQGVEAGKALMGETLWDKFKESIGLEGPAEGEAGLEAATTKAFPGAATPGAGNSMAGWSVKR
jgi:hypothetical protein